MKVLSLKADFSGADLNEQDKAVEPIQASVNVIKSVILAYASSQKGLTEKDRRITYKILDVLDDATKEKSESVNMDDDWIGFIRLCFRETRLMPTLILRSVEKLIESIKDR